MLRLNLFALCVVSSRVPQKRGCGRPLDWLTGHIEGAGHCVQRDADKGCCEA